MPLLDELKTELILTHMIVTHTHTFMFEIKYIEIWTVKKTEKSESKMWRCAGKVWRSLNFSSKSELVSYWEKSFFCMISLKKKIGIKQIKIKSRD